jgi:hypothetical protein
LNVLQRGVETFAQHDEVPLGIDEHVFAVVVDADPSTRLAQSIAVCTENLSSGVVVVKSAKDGM